MNKICNPTPRSLVHSYNIRFNTNISLSHVRTNLAANFVLSNRVEMYNSLPNDLKSIDDLHKIKRTAKLYLLKIYLYCGRLQYHMFIYIYIHIYLG